MKLEIHQLDERFEHLRICDPAGRSRLTASLSEFGQQSPVLVTREDGDRYVLVDGYRRVEALRRLGRDTVEAQVLTMDAADALVAHPVVLVAKV